MQELHIRRTSRTRRATRPVPFAALALLLAAAGAGCDRIEWVEPMGEGAVTVETVAATPTIGDSPASTSVPLLVDVVAVEPPSSRVAAMPRAGTTPIDLAALRTMLDVPVAGVPRSHLRDSFTERRGDRVHEALDILATRGTPVLSAADGRLLKIFDSRAGGLMLYATDPSERFILLYGHLDRYAEGMSEGMRLVRGQVIGYVGSTGNAPVGTPHLHFGILRGDPDVSWWSGIAVNPYPLLASTEISR